jgi:site-specific recombinase XerD
MGYCKQCYERSDIPRRCIRCGVNRIPSPVRFGLCVDCAMPEPERVLVWLGNRPAETAAEMPPWFVAVASEWAQSCQHQPTVAIRHLRRVETAVLEVGVRPDRVLQALDCEPKYRPARRLLQEYFVRNGMLAADDPADHRARRRHKHLDRIDPRLRPAIARYVDNLDTQNHRADLYGMPRLTDRTIEYQLKGLRQFAEHLAEQGITDWATVATGDIERYLQRDIDRTVCTLKAFFKFARRRRLVLTDPAKPLKRQQHKGYRGRLLTVQQQRELLDRWRRDDIDPRERAVGCLCLLHAASNSEVRHLHASHVAADLTTVKLGKRPNMVPLDPVTADALSACLTQRGELNTTNPHLLIAPQTRLHDDPCSANLLSILLRKAGVTPQVLRATRLTDLTQRLDPRVVAEALGINKGTALHYVIGAVDREKIVFDQKPTRNRLRTK